MNAGGIEVGTENRFVKIESFFGVPREVEIGACSGHERNLKDEKIEFYIKLGDDQGLREINDCQGSTAPDLRRISVIAG